jgi:hypothetical protein
MAVMTPATIPAVTVVRLNSPVINEYVLGVLFNNRSS